MRVKSYFLSDFLARIIAAHLSASGAKKGFRKNSKALILLVGTTGFEPATSRTPSERATRLRYVPENSTFKYKLTADFVQTRHASVKSRGAAAAFL